MMRIILKRMILIKAMITMDLDLEQKENDADEDIKGIGQHF